MTNQESAQRKPREFWLYNNAYEDRISISRIENFGSRGWISEIHVREVIEGQENQIRESAIREVCEWLRSEEADPYNWHHESLTIAGEIERRFLKKEGL